MKNYFSIIFFIFALSPRILLGQNINAYGSKLQELENFDDIEKDETKEKKRREILTDNPEDITTNRYYLDYEYNLELTQSNDLNEDITMHERDALTGVVTNIHNTFNDKHRSSLIFLFDPRILKEYQLYTFEFIYGHKFENWSFEWFISTMTADFYSVARNHAHGSSSSVAEENTPRIDDDQETLLSTGIGANFRFKLLQGIIQSNRYFETVSSSLALGRLTDSMSGLSYYGPGLKTDYGIHRRFSSNFHLGLKMSYNIYSLKRTENYATEVSDDRALTLQWISLGFDATFYY
jgi:hypothetical protein